MPEPTPPLRGKSAAERTQAQRHENTMSVACRLILEGKEREAATVLHRAVRRARSDRQSKHATRQDAANQEG